MKPNEKAAFRRDLYKSSVGADDGRLRRVEITVDIGKAGRNAQLEKRRRGGLPAASAAVSHSSAPQHKVCSRSFSLGKSGLFARGQVGDSRFDCSVSVFAFVQLEGLPAMVQSVYSDDVAVQLEAITQFRKILSIGKALLASTSRL
jgi:hypothetical protein